MANDPKAALEAVIQAAMVDLQRKMMRTFHQAILYGTGGIPHGQHRSAASPAQSDPAQPPGGADPGAVDLAAYNAALQRAVAALVAESGPRPIPDAGIRAGEIRAWRAWNVQGEGLFSIFMEGVHWPPGQPMTGDVSKHGVFAFKTLKDVAGYIGMEHHFAAEHYQMIGRQMVLGEVDLWGEVIEHERGYRAEFAQVVSLVAAFPSDNSGLLGRLCEVYFGGREPTPLFYSYHAKAIREWLAALAENRAGPFFRIAPKVGLSTYPFFEVVTPEPSGFARVVTLVAETVDGGFYRAKPADAESARLIAEWKP